VTLWWGEPWPSDELRAAICEDDAQRIDIPVGYPCALCDLLIEDYDRGITMMGIDADGKAYPVQEHIECQMRHVMGCYDLVSTGSAWTPDHVCSGADDYREDALRVWAWLQRHGEE
jgi:hypothetical protein